MSKLDKFFEDLEELEFPAAIKKVNSYIYDALEAQQSKSGGGCKVTLEILRTTKKCMDYVSLTLVKAHRDCVANEVKLKTMVTDSKAYEALLKRRSGTVETLLDRYGDRLMRRRVVRLDMGYSVLVTPSECTVQEFREKLKKAYKDNENFLDFVMLF